MPTRSSFSVFRILEVALVISLLNTNSVSRADGQSLRRFTIKDSIELSQFSNPHFWLDQSGPPDRFDSLPRSSMGISDNGEGSGGD